MKKQSKRKLNAILQFQMMPFWYGPKAITEKNMWGLLLLVYFNLKVYSVTGFKNSKGMDLTHT